MAAMSDSEHKVSGLELLLPDPEYIAQIRRSRGSEADEADDSDDDYFEPPHAA